MMLRKTRKKIPGKYTGGDLKKKSNKERKEGNKNLYLYSMYLHNLGYFSFLASLIDLSGFMGTCA